MAQADIFVRSVQLKMWRHSWFLALVVFTFFLFYVNFEAGAWSLQIVSNAVAATAAMMIGSSFALSGFCYYWDFLDSKIGYRKYLGLVGFWLALVYSMMLLFVDPARYFFGFFENLASYDFVFGLTAMSILTLMAVISNTTAMKILGPKNWRRILRLGYLAYFLLVLRAYDLEKMIWFDWLERFDSLPPPRLVVAGVALGVILFRFSMIVAKVIRRHQPTPL
jgi:DMSO/TMAO reductase YedYZ heme-binding membrane subunit